MQKKTFANKRVLILGLGISGRSATEFLLSQKALVHGCDRDFNIINSHPEIQSLKERGLIIHSEKEFQNLEQFEHMIVSPGISPSHPLVLAAKQIGIPTMGEIELGCLAIENPMIGITGTNGKTTVTLLVTHVLNHAGYPAKALGNVGVPLTRELLCMDPHHTIVLELSSYQIETLYQTCLNYGAILNITPNHLDRHQTMEGYAKAKCDIVRALKPEGELLMEERAWNAYGHFLKVKKPLLYGYSHTSDYFTDLSSVFRKGRKAFDLPSSLKGRKSHDLENILAAYALCVERNVSEEAFLEALESFKKPDHRIQFLTKQRGVSYYDDSKGTNLDAVIRAVESLQGPVILIAGGVDKGADYIPWLEVFKNKVKLICAIGQAAGKINAQIGQEFPVAIFNSLEDAIYYARQFAQEGDNVLLSPGCSSFDMFKDYVHRGQEFQRIIREFPA